MELRTYLDQQRGRGAALARALGISPTLISQWAYQIGGRVVPAERCPAIERATAGAVRCEDLRPDIPWGVLREAKPGAGELTHAPIPPARGDAGVTGDSPDGAGQRRAA